MTDFANRAVTALVALLCIAAPVRAQEAPAASSPVPTVVGKNGMVVAQESRAARVGVDILQRGGNAVDAAVAIGFALAVTYPRAGNLGGGGYMVIHLARQSFDTTIDFRETAPAAITRNIFLDDKGDADPAKSRDSALAVGVPGSVAGLALAHAKYGSGRFTLADLLAPATEPGTPTASAESRDFAGSASPLSFRKMSRVIAAGAVSR